MAIRKRIQIDPVTKEKILEKTDENNKKILIRESVVLRKKEYIEKFQDRLGSELSEVNETLNEFNQ